MSSIDEMVDLERMATIREVREYADHMAKENTGLFARFTSTDSGSSDTGGFRYYIDNVKKEINQAYPVDDKEEAEEEDPQLLFNPEELVLK